MILQRNASMTVVSLDLRSLGSRRTLGHRNIRHLSCTLFAEKTDRELHIELPDEGKAPGDDGSNNWLRN